MKPDATIPLDEKLIVLAAGRLRTHDAPWELVLLTPDYLNDVKKLHDLVRENLPPAQKSFILHRDLSYFATHFQRNGGSITLGARSQGRLIGKGVIFHPEHDTPLSDLAGSVAPDDVPPEQTSILQAVTVHPEFRNNGIFQAMIHYWLNHAKKFDKSHALAEIEVRNAASWHAFLKAGLHIVNLGPSPIDGAQIYSAHEWLPQDRIKYALRVGFDPALADNGGDTHLCPQEDLVTQKQLLNEGFVVSDVDETGQLILRRP